MLQPAVPILKSTVCCTANSNTHRAAPVLSALLHSDVGAGPPWVTGLTTARCCCSCWMFQVSLRREPPCP